MLFKNLAEEWITQKRDFIKESTYALYLYEIENYLCPCMGQEEVSDIGADRLQNAVLEWQCGENGDGRTLKKSTVQNLVALTKQIMTYAMKKGYAGPMQAVIHYAPQSRARRARRILGDEEQLQLIDALLSAVTPETFEILLCVNSGLRIGELCALTWSDLDLGEQILHVTKTMQRIYRRDASPKSHIAITSPKTETSVRDIPLSDKICALAMKIAGRKPHHYILSNSERYMEPRTFRKHYECFLNTHGIPHINFHSLRHAFATRCIESGADCKVVSELLGHSTVNTTLNMYVHPQMSDKRKCVEAVCWN